MDEFDGDRERQSLRRKATGKKRETSEGSKICEEDEDGDDEDEEYESKPRKKAT